MIGHLVVHGQMSTPLAALGMQQQNHVLLLVHHDFLEGGGGDGHHGAVPLGAVAVLLGYTAHLGGG